MNVSGASLSGGTGTSAPSPNTEFALPPLDSAKVISCAPWGGHVSDVCHRFEPIVKYVTRGSVSRRVDCPPFRNLSKNPYVISV